MIVPNVRRAAAFLLFASAAARAQYLVYAGTERGIQGFRLDTRSARMKPLGALASGFRPVFLVEHPDHRYLYAASEDSPGQARSFGLNPDLYAVREDSPGQVRAFLLHPKTGKLTLVNQVSTHGDGACHLALDREGRWLAVSNCASGSVAILPLRRDGGMVEPLSVTPLPGSGAHPLGLTFSPDNRFLLVADTGLARICVFRFDAATGALTPADPPLVSAPPGAGAAYLAFHPNGQVLYASSPVRPAVSTYRYDPPSGQLREIQTLTTSDDGPGFADIAVNAGGTVVYASHPASDSMGLFVVDPVRFSLSLLEMTPLAGRAPGHFAFDPTGAFLLVPNRDSASLTLYTVHAHTGQLRPTGHPVVNLDNPTCAVIVPAR